MNSHKLTILAQDPAVRLNGCLAFTQVDVPNEMLSPGPVGYRVKVVDFDASANVLYRSLQYEDNGAGETVDPFVPPANLNAEERNTWEIETLTKPGFHAQNVYAIVMRTLARFEFALGRRVRWGFSGHQINVAPHAFCEPNAFYSAEDHALFFGYFKSMKTDRRIFTCLSHDIVAHETTHALLDGLRDGFTTPSSPDQAAFHEGFADIVALLSVFSLPVIVEAALLGEDKPQQARKHDRLISSEMVSEKAIIHSILFGLGKEFGMETSDAHANCLRRSVALEPSPEYLKSVGYQEEHERGEVFAAAMLRSFLSMWLKRIGALGTFEGDKYNLDLVIEEGTKAADNLLTMAIRALDYCPPVDLTFGDYLAALLTSDTETAPDDERFNYRALVKSTFTAFGIVPPPECTDPATGCWIEFVDHGNISYNRTHHDSMLHDLEEVFRFVWENRGAFRLEDPGYLRVKSVRPSVRQGPDGFFLRETICEYVLTAQIYGAEVNSWLKMQLPKDMPTTQPVTAYGGGVLIFDQYGRIKYHIEQRLDNVARQSERLKYLWDHGLLNEPANTRSRFAAIHRSRVS